MSFIIITINSYHHHYNYFFVACCCLYVFLCFNVYSTILASLHARSCGLQAFYQASILCYACVKMSYNSDGCRYWRRGQTWRASCIVVRPVSVALINQLILLPTITSTGPARATFQTSTLLVSSAYRAGVHKQRNCGFYRKILGSCSDHIFRMSSVYLR